VLGLAVLLQVGAGLVGVVAYLWRTDYHPFAAYAEPHPLDAWAGPAAIAWFAVVAVLLLLTGWSTPRRRFAAQLLLPVAGLAAWLAVVGLVAPYPVTLRAELRDGAMTLTAAALAPGPQSLAIRNATGTSRRVTALRSDRPLDAAALAEAYEPPSANGQWTSGVEWFHLKPIACFMDCEPGDLQIGPGDQVRHAVDLVPGYYAIVCVRVGGRPGNTYRIVVDGHCRPALFTVGLGPTGPRGPATPAA
jgi:hypothetical protein